MMEFSLGDSGMVSQRMNVSQEVRHSHKGLPILYVGGVETI